MRLARPVLLALALLVAVQVVLIARTLVLPDHAQEQPSRQPSMRGAAESTITDEAAFARHIDSLQHPPDCRAAPLYIFAPTPYTSGFGSQVRIASHSLLEAVALRRTFVLDGASSVYISPSRCPSKHYDCIFRRVTNCAPTDREPLPHPSPGEPAPARRLPHLSSHLARTQARWTMGSLRCSHQLTARALQPSA